MRISNFIFLFILLIHGKSLEAQGKLPYYDQMYSFREGFTMIEVNNGYGIINDSLQEIIAPEFESIRCYDYGPFHFKGTFFAFRGDSTILFDTLGHIKTVIHDKNVWPHNYFSSEDWNFTIYDLECTNSSLSSYSPIWGCEKAGKEIIPHEYSYIFKGLSGHIIAQTNNQNGTHFYNQKGEILKEFNWPIELCIQETLDQYWIRKEGLYVCLDSLFNIVYLSDFDMVKDPKDHLLCVSRKGNWGIIDENFDFVISPEYEDVGLNKHWGYVKKNGFYGLIDTEGNEMGAVNLTTTGSFSQYMTPNKKVTALKGDQIVIIDSSGKCIANCESQDTINKKFTNGNKWVEGSFNNYWRSGTWNYYRNDNNNSKELSIMYTDSLIYFTEFDSLENVTEEYTDKRKQMLTY